MPTGLILHKGHALTLDGVRKDAAGLTGNHRRTERRLDGVQIMTVDLIEIKAEGAELGGQDCPDS